MKTQPLVSIIVTTRNEADVIGRLLKSIRAQTYKNIESIVVDNHSTDNTIKIARNLADKVYEWVPERSAQRNFGAKKSKGEFLVFLDADMALSQKVIGECVNQVQKDKNVGGVIIPEISVGKNFWEKVKIFERSFYFDQDSFATDAARFFSKKIFILAGGYDETITGTEDWDLSETVRKLGVKIGRIVAPIYHHERITSLLKHAKKFYYYGLTSHRTLFKQNAIIGPKTFYLLRPAFYKRWYRLLVHPILTFGMLILLSAQLLAGTAGFIVGKIRNV